MDAHGCCQELVTPTCFIIFLQPLAVEPSCCLWPELVPVENGAMTAKRHKTAWAIQQQKSENAGMRGKLPMIIKINGFNL